MNGIFTISLDFELHWGGFEKWTLNHSYQSPVTSYQNRYSRYFLNTRLAIPKMLELFQRYEIHATWAAVGMLLNDSKEELLTNAPGEKPSYLNQHLSAFRFIDTMGIGDNEELDPFHFAPSLVKVILDTPGQELGTHTYAHFYCNEPGQTVEQFRADLNSAKKVSEKYGVTLRSLVFPRNQFNVDYLRVCREEGITSVRSNPLDWFWKIDSTENESMWKRLNRGLDAYLPIGRKNTYRMENIPYDEKLPLCLPASRLLRPYRPSELFLNRMKINRICSEMERAARAGETYHLWWHPHNFGNHPQQSLDGLGAILRHYQHCRNRYGMQSLNMAETSNLVLRLHGKAEAA
ncbi:MAG: polysaccharide deacetylase family protein [Cyclobacteriaceae bacterium]